jgi:glycerol-3-phosphate dehydrogenase
VAPQLDYGQLKLVLEALRERQHMLVAAPHLSNPLPTLTPCYAWWEVPYYWAGLKAYDLVAGAAGLTWSRFVTATAAHKLFPPLAGVRSGDAQQAELKGGIVYFDGQMDDARINVALATTASLAGATVVNHVRVARLIKVRQLLLLGVSPHS